jgi:hypothetical protein
VNIKTKHEDIHRRLKENSLVRMALETELEALQEVCPHADVKEWTHHDYVGDSDLHWQCKDCGKYKLLEDKRGF